jgi:hypothetical protein
METKEKIKRCFVIGPMKDMTRLLTLANEVVRPILEPEGYDIITPDQGHIGTIMDQVLLNLEQADILVADVTGNNPNVMYELGVYHSFGKPSLIIKDKSIAEDLELTPFDIAAYRFIGINLNDVPDSIAILTPRIKEILSIISILDWFPNPVTSFYNSPVAEIPTAVGLSKNYVKNFLKLMWPDVFLKNEESESYLYKVSVEDKENGMMALDFEARQKMKFEILIPEKMKMSNHNYIRDLKSGKILQYSKAEVNRLTRPFSLHARTDDSGAIVLADIPSVLSTLYESIQSRRGLKETQINNRDWLLLEAQELERFAIKCENYKREVEDNFPSLRNRINIVWRWNPEE